jgi:hypothetical protein
MHFVHFTRPDGQSIGIVTAQVVNLREPIPGEMDPRANTVIVLQTGFQAVRETMTEVEVALAKF